MPSIRRKAILLPAWSGLGIPLRSAKADDRCNAVRETPFAQAGSFAKGHDSRWGALAAKMILINCHDKPLLGRYYLHLPQCGENRKVYKGPSVALGRVII